MSGPAAGFVAGRHAIEAYGAGGFRFAGMSHRGSILALPAGVHAIEAQSLAGVPPEALAPLISAADTLDLVLVGTGVDPAPLPAALRATLADAGLRRVDAMTTAAAARTYNVLVAEGRRVAALLIAVA